jgi:tetratricopeptide (TPR) repeat protein
MPVPKNHRAGPDPHARPGPPWRATGVLVGVLALLGSACDSPKEAPRPGVDTGDGSAAPAKIAVPEAGGSLAAARTRLAGIAIERSSPDEALPLLVSALHADPSSQEAMEMLRSLVRDTRWNVPETFIPHPAPIERIHFPNPESLWVGLAGTLARWDLGSLELTGTLFPLADAEATTRSLVADSESKFLLVERAGVLLVCAADSLKPLHACEAPPSDLTPSAVLVFSPDGLLFAHPAAAGDPQGSVVWHLRDAATGGIVRSSDASPPGAPRPLAAHLDRRCLRVLHQDGSLLEIPVSPLEEVVHTPFSETIRLLHAQFTQNGGAALVLEDRGAHRPPENRTLELGGPADASLDPAALLEAHPWNAQPTIWSGLLRDPGHALLWVEDSRVDVLTGGLAPLHAGSPVSALAFRGDQVAVGTRDGMLTIHRVLPLPAARPGSHTPAPVDQAAMATLTRLAACLAGTQCGPKGLEIERLTLEQRLEAARSLDPQALDAILPDVDFAPVLEILRAHTRHSADPAASEPFRQRFARAGLDPAARAVHAADLLELESRFREADGVAVIAAIAEAGTHGAFAAKALELALASDQPGWIDACLRQAEGLPMVVKRLAVSRIAWLQNRKADAMSAWPEGFPDLAQVRLREDWDGWEQADFGPALDLLQQGVRELLDALVIPEDSTPEQRDEVFQRLADPDTIQIVGRARFANACLQAALAMSEFQEETEKTFQLATLARNHGADPAPCLRAEALALTALGDYEKAHQRWIQLITAHPVESHEPGDYAEASYTAFENADPRQAMAILTTGLHRFPEDANFALRAGWVALLTGNSERAYRFLLTGRQIGYPPEKLENATALLAIAAIQTGADEDAGVFYQDLIALDPAWEDPATLESLEWPEELKSSLRQLIW